MTAIDWTSLLAPVVAGLVLAVAGLLGALLTGLVGKASAYLTAHGDAAAASAIASANAVIQPALQTGASVIAGEISSGKLDYADRAAVTARALEEVKLVETRVADMVKIANPIDGALVASLMGKVDSAVVASPTIPSVPAKPSA